MPPSEWYSFPYQPVFYIKCSFYCPHPPYSIHFSGSAKFEYIHFHTFAFSPQPHLQVWVQSFPWAVSLQFTQVFIFPIRIICLWVGYTWGNLKKVKRGSPGVTLPLCQVHGFSPPVAQRVNGMAMSILTPCCSSVCSQPY